MRTPPLAAATISLTLILAMLSLTACNGSDSPAGSGGGGTAGIAVNGNVAGPVGAIAKATPSSKSWFASLFEVAEAFAQQVTGWSAVPNATVRIFRIDNNTGAPVGTTLIPPVTTAADGSFSLTLPTGTVLDSTLVAQVESDPAINGPVPVGTPNTYSTLLVQTTIALNPAVEAATRAIVNDPAPLSNFSNAEVTQILSGISTLVAQNPPAGNVTDVTTNFGAAITSAVNATSGTTVGAPVILTNAGFTLPNGTAGTTYSTTLVAVGGTGTLTWALDSAPTSLPTGVTLGANGQLSGIPQQNGTFPLTVRVTDAANPAQSASEDLSLSITPAAPPSITTASPLPAGVVNQAYSKTFAATGGTGTLTWTSTGTLPSGLSPVSPGGVLSGTPQAGSAGIYNISVTVTDATTPTPQSVTKDFALTITAAPQPPTITTTSPLPNGTVGTLYTQPLAATGGLQPYTWSVLPGGSLPSSALSTAGLISITPTVATTLNFTVQVMDANNLTAQQALSITINPTGGSTGSANVTVTNATPTSGNASISGTSFTVTTTFDTFFGVPVTRVETTDGTRTLLVYFATTGGAVQAMSYVWGGSNVVNCPAGDCTGVASVNQTTKVITFPGAIALNGFAPSPGPPTGPPTVFATLNGTIQYP